MVFSIPYVVIKFICNDTSSSHSHSIYQKFILAYESLIIQFNFYAKSLKTRQTGNWSVLHDYSIVNIIVRLKVIRRLSNSFVTSLTMKLGGTASNPTGSISSFSIKGTPCWRAQNNNKLRSKVFC